MIERGPDVSFANCGLPYYVGGEIGDRDVLAVQTPASLRSPLNLDVRTRSEAVTIDRANKRVEIRHLQNGGTEWQPYDKLMLAPGASPLRRICPVSTTLASYSSQSGRHGSHCGGHRVGHARRGDRRRLYRTGDGRTTAPQGTFGATGGIAAASAATNGCADDSLAGKRIAPTRYRYHSGGRSGSISALHRPSALSPDGRQMLDADIVVLSIGVKPDTALARSAGLQLGPRGHIVVDEFQRTSDPDIYAAGDAVVTRDRVMGEQIAVPLGGPTNRQGASLPITYFWPTKPALIQARLEPPSCGALKPWPGSLAGVKSV